MHDVGRVATLISRGALDQVRAELASMPLPDLAHQLERLPLTSRAVAYQLLPRQVSLRVFEQLVPDTQAELVTALPAEDVGELLAALEPDVRATALDALPGGVAHRLLQVLDADERQLTLSVLAYPPQSVGRRMTPQVCWLPSGMTVGEALERVRREGERAETVYMLPVVGQDHMVLGVVSLRRLLLSDPAARIDALMSAPILVEAETDQEVAARTVQQHGALAVPVVDAADRLVGVLTVDDVLRILQTEESEDTARASGARPLTRPYLSTPLFQLVRGRVVWLLVLVLAAGLTVNVLDFFEETLASVVSLALFIPLLIGTGGNVGAQSASTVVRALALDHVRPGELPAVLAREAAVGGALGLGLAVPLFVPAALVAGMRVATVLSLSLVIVCILAAAAGGSIPLIGRRLGVDPAVVSAPFITTVVDASGLVVYFLIARAVLGV